PNQQVGQGEGLLEGPVGGGNATLLGAKGLTLGPTPVPGLRVPFRLGTGVRPLPHVDLARHTADTDAPVVKQARPPTLPTHVVLPPAVPPPQARVLPYGDGAGEPPATESRYLSRLVRLARGGFEKVEFTLARGVVGPLARPPLPLG